MGILDQYAGIAAEKLTLQINQTKKQLCFTINNNQAVCNVSQVDGFLWKEKDVGSNPTTPTIYKSKGDLWEWQNTRRNQKTSKIRKRKNETACGCFISFVS